MGQTGSWKYKAAQEKFMGGTAVKKTVAQRTVEFWERKQAAHE